MTTTTTTTTTELTTDQVLVELLTENTGSHFLDSGGAYGRNWQRNQGKTLEDFLAVPAARVDGSGYVTLDLFHWLRARLEYDPEETARFNAHAEGSDEPWLVDMESYAESVHVREYRHEGWRCFNSYNEENCLSQDIQWVEYRRPLIDEDGEEWGEPELFILLQVHGGCDARGGYTSPRAFKVTGYEQMFGYDMGDYELFCNYDPAEDLDPSQLELEGMPPAPEFDHHYLSVRGGDISDNEGSFVGEDIWKDQGLEMFTSPEDEGFGHDYVPCPYCHKAGRLRKMEASAPEPY